MSNRVRNKSENIKNSIDKSLEDIDKEIFKKPGVMNTFLGVLEEAFRLDHKGALQEARTYKYDWGFPLYEIKYPIYLWHGEEDLNVKIAAAKHLANQLPNCIPKFYLTEGHISLLSTHTNEILGLFAT